MINNVKLGFSWIGLIVFLLPMLINIVYVILPPKNAPATQQETNKVLEIIEQSTRILFIFSAIWLNNYIAVLFMIIFGIAHNIISYKSF